jgi:hypothetical protein
MVLASIEVDPMSTQYGVGPQPTDTPRPDLVCPYCNATGFMPKGYPHEGHAKIITWESRIGWKYVCLMCAVGGPLLEPDVFGKMPATNGEAP